jgi:hypothetical protein
MIGAMIAVRAENSPPGRNSEKANDEFAAFNSAPLHLPLLGAASIRAKGCCWT